MVLDRGRQIGGLFWSANIPPRRVHLFPPRLLSENKAEMCRPRHEVGGGVNDLHCCATHSQGVLKPRSTVTVHTPTSSFTSHHMFTPTSEVAFRKEGTLCLSFRKIGQHIAALTLEQMCRLFYLKRATLSQLGRY